MQRLYRPGGRATLLVAWVAVSVLVLPGAAAANPLAPASPQARLSTELFWVTTAIALVVLVAVEALLIYTSLRFRRKAGVELPEPPQIHGNGRLEAMWTILPALILVSLFILSVRTLGEISTLSGSPRVIQVVGRQFSWEFTYPDEKLKSTNDLRVPVGSPVVLEITSADVIHSFWVPALSGKVDANPGLTTRLSFTAEQPGTYRGVCSELCGVGHANMLFNVTAMDAAEFDAWLKSGGQASGAVAAAPAAPAAGPAGAVSSDAAKKLLVDKGCGGCHTIAGSPGMAGTTGPPLTNVASTADKRKPGLSAEAYLRESILQPQAFAVPGFPPVMPKLDLTDDEVTTIVTYLLTLK